MKQKLVIVESPAKARTLGQYLGAKYLVMASYGHVRDLPESKFGIDPENDFKADYVIVPKSKKIVSVLKAKLKDAEELYLATDLDREGEAIAWHLVQALGLADHKHSKSNKLPIKRITFHEITKQAIEAAIKAPREINQDLVNAQQTRRILDRIVGYKLSPFLWKKIYRGLSAGRVQSVAVRLIVERENEIKNFNSRTFYTIEAQFDINGQKFKASFCELKSKQKLEFSAANKAEEFILKLKRADWRVKEVIQQVNELKPRPPLITSTLQQAAARLLGYSAIRTMKIAQDLYEGIPINGETTGLITYTRTDSYFMASSAIEAIRSMLKNDFDQKYLPSKQNVYKQKARTQEAHEAIRPVDFKLSPERLKGVINRDQWRLYDLIYRYAFASQMSNAQVRSITVAITSDIDQGLFIARGKKLLFDGFLKVFSDEDDLKFVDLPDLHEEDQVKLKSVVFEEHTTEPPARYSEASLIKELEKREIGRPSTYAPTIQTIISRGYVYKENNRLVPNEVAQVVTNLLVEHFPDIVDYQFTAKLETDLDEIAACEKEWLPVLREFYYPFIKQLEIKEAEVNAKDLKEHQTDLKCPKCQNPVVIKLGRYGEYYSCSQFPNCVWRAPILKVDSESRKFIEQKLAKPCPNCGQELALKQSKFGQFIGCGNYPNCKYMESIAPEAKVPCPNCSGKIILKKSRRGKAFWGCANYPKCQTAFWYEPIDKKCPKCSNLLVKKDSEFKCSQCDYHEPNTAA